MGKIYIWCSKYYKEKKSKEGSIENIKKLEFMFYLGQSG